MPAPEPEQRTLSWNVVRGWRSSDLDDAAVIVKNVITYLTHEYDDLCGAKKDDDWQGLAAEAARHKEAQLQSHIDQHIAQLGVAKKALDDAATAVSKLEIDVRTVEGFAGSFGFALSGSGEVSDPNPPPLPVGSNFNDAREQADHRTDLINQCTGMMTDILVQAAQIDSDLMARLGVAISTIPGVPQTTNLQAVQAYGQQVEQDATKTIPSPPTTGPDAVAAWWKSLSPIEQQRAIKENPEQISNLDGVPCAVRSQINKAAVANDYVTSTLELNNFDRDNPEPPRYDYEDVGPPLETPEWKQWHSKKQKLQNKVDGCTAIYERGHNDPNFYVIGYQPDVGNGQAITSAGNPDTATHTATFVTGMTTHLGGIGDDITRSDQMRRSAVLAGAASQKTAAITWYGYKAPQNIYEAGHISYAHAAAPALQQFQHSLRVTHEASSKSTNVVIGHSFGTAVIGDAASHDGTLDADRFIALGSPGVTVENGRDLHFTGWSPSDEKAHIFASTADHDIIHLADNSTLGKSPDDDDFGSTVFSTPSAKSLNWMLGYSTDSHKAYWIPNNIGLVNIGKIIYSGKIS